MFLGVCSFFPWKTPLENPKVSEFKPEPSRVINERASGCGAALQASSLRRQVPARSAPVYWRWNERCQEGGRVGAATGGLKTPL